MNHKEEKLFFTDKLMNIYFLKKEEEGRNQDRFFVKFFKTDRILSVSGHILASLMSISTTYCQIDWFVIVLKKTFRIRFLVLNGKIRTRATLFLPRKLKEFANYSSKIIFFGEDEKEHGSGLQCCGAGAGLFSWIRSQWKKLRLLAVAVWLRGTVVAK